MDHMYKSQLQSYALKQNMELPVYAAERQGPAHAPRFRCKVTVCGQTFQSQEFCPTLKAAEHAAAKVALASLTPLNPEGVVVDVAYKNLLQEISQKENSLLPVYATATSGPSHAPTFTSTVEFAGNLYRGEEAKTKKLAEMNAAKVAFMSIKYGHPNQTPSSPSLTLEKQEAANSNVKSSEQVSPSQLSKMVTPDVPSKWIEVYEDELPDVLNAPANSVKAINITASPVATHPTNDATLTAAPAATEMMNVAAADSSAIMPMNNVNESSARVEESEKKLVMGSGYQSIPSGQHVVCRPWNPGMTLPEDAEMLFRDDRFIAYRVVKQ
ncbi:PREDICTED: double-stranded RNA-binding protein 4 [Brassica oleracea var. oleracea]|uniref:DRBM domain-containing protein n=1 Tax=Brassica oleracea var. oleracea TaxID=109376 RepID=A0A0D3DV60_BRAOL|nr:PREDICTED: double-stranded RNA-binding protein 4 [Brassica oleracea var. oleracea]